MCSSMSWLQKEWQFWSYHPNCLRSWGSAIGSWSCMKADLWLNLTDPRPRKLVLCRLPPAKSKVECRHFMRSSSYSPQVLNLIRTNSGVAILLSIAGLLSVLSKDVLTSNNLLTVSLQTSMIAITSIGMTFTLITGGVDLSVGAVAALSGALASGLATRNGLGTYPAILLALIAGAG